MSAQRLPQRRASAGSVARQLAFQPHGKAVAALFNAQQDRILQTLERWPNGISHMSLLNTVSRSGAERQRMARALDGLIAAGRVERRSNGRRQLVALASGATPAPTAPARPAAKTRARKAPSPSPATTVAEFEAAGGVIQRLPPGQVSRSELRFSHSPTVTPLRRGYLTAPYR